MVGALGIRMYPYDPVTTEINRLYDERGAAEKKMAALRQQGINAENPTKEYTRLLASVRGMNRRLYELSKKRGDKVPLGSPPPKSELSPQEQMRREFEEYTKQGGKSPADELRKEFERFAKGGR